MPTDFPLAQNEPTRVALAEALAETAAPAFLRSRILARYRRRKRLFASASISIAVVATFAAWWLLQIANPVASAPDWHARSVALEASWRETGDNDWLGSDARAEPLLTQLRQLDSQLANLLDDTSESNAAVLASLWKARSDTLSALIESRRQGGFAVRL